MVLSATTDVEPVTSGKWAPYQRPVRPSAGVDTEWNCDKLRDGGDALVTAVPADLISRARAGDGNAFRELTEPHRRELQVHCYRMLGSLQDAEDALQDTLLAAWQGFGGFEGRATLRTWLYRIATNQCLNARRSASRRPAREWDVPNVDRPSRSASARSCGCSHFRTRCSMVRPTCRSDRRHATSRPNPPRWPS
ncbi:MAG TPA: sigma factor [Mycobacterium sp.]